MSEITWLVGVEGGVVSVPGGGGGGGGGGVPPHDVFQAVGTDPVLPHAINELNGESISRG